MEWGLGKPRQHPTLPETGCPIPSRLIQHVALVPGGTQLQMAAWPALPSPAAGPPSTKPECPQETGYLSPGGVRLDSRLQLQPGCFAMSLEKALIPGRILEWNASCQQGCG